MTKIKDNTLLAKAGSKTIERAVIDLRRSTDYLTRHDIAAWRTAWQMAINVDRPSRLRLYDIYRDTEVDAHLSGCVRQREGFVMARSFRLVDARGNEDAQAAHIFSQPWFRTLCRYILDSVYWGHSLIELGDVVQDGDGCPAYDSVSLIPRKHVVPEFHRILIDTSQDPRDGIDYREEPVSAWLIEAGLPDDLGLYLKASQHTIAKKNMLSFWDTFGEIFGMPMRIAKTSSRDKAQISKLSRMLSEMGSSGSGVLPLDTEIQFVESAKGDAFNVYDKRIERANSEISKLIIGQTMTIEDGSSLSQSQTHLEVFENLIEDDADFLADIINTQLLPRMVRHGFPVASLRFEWNEAVDYTPEQQIAYETMIADRYDVDPEYFATKYGMPVGERRDPYAAMAPHEDSSTDKGKAENALRKPFFD